MLCGGTEESSAPSSHIASDIRGRRECLWIVGERRYDDGCGWEKHASPLAAVSAVQFRH